MGSIADTVRAERATELERLGSDRGLIALTDAELEAATIRSRYGGVVAGAAGVIDSWDGEFGEAAATLSEIADDLGVDDPETGVGVVESLRGLEEQSARLGAGLIGTPLVLDGWALQGVSYFVNEADERGADQFRSVRRDLETVLEIGESQLADSSEEIREGASSAAIRVIDAAYEAYVATLDSMGLEPKTVC